MIGYILGMTLGSIVLIVCFIIVSRKLYDLRTKSNLIKRIGMKAEKIINKDIREWARLTQNKFIDSNFYKYNNKVFEVNSILITDKALIVIVIKSIKGNVNGDAKKDSWTKIVGDKSFPILNSIKQNDKHIAHITDMLQINVPTISLIIYSNNTDYIDILNKPDYAVITKHNKLFEVLDKINSSLPTRINNQNRKIIYNEIRYFRTNKFKDKKLYTFFKNKTKRVY